MEQYLLVFCLKHWLFKRQPARKISANPGLEPGIFGLILVLVLIYEPLGIYGRWLKD